MDKKLCVLCGEEFVGDGDVCAYCEYFDAVERDENHNEWMRKGLEEDLRKQVMGE